MAVSYHSKSFIFIAILVAVSFSCNENDKLNIEKSAAAFDIKQAEASIAQSNQNLMKSFKAGDSAGVGNITHFMSGAMKRGIKEIDISTTQIWGDSSIVTEEGVYPLSDSAGKQIDKGKYIVLWKQEAGNWKMFRDIWNTDITDSASLRNPAIIKLTNVKH
jgi:hypothetical protein